MSFWSPKHDIIDYSYIDACLLNETERSLVHLTYLSAWIRNTIEYLPVSITPSFLFHKI